MVFYGGQADYGDDSSDTKYSMFATTGNNKIKVFNVLPLPNNLFVRGFLFMCIALGIIVVVMVALIPIASLIGLQDQLLSAYQTVLTFIYSRLIGIVSGAALGAVQGL